MIYHSPSQVDFELADVPEIPTPGRVLMTRPDHFAVEYTINPHMEGNIGSVDKEEASVEWSHLRRLYEHLGIETLVLPGQQHLPDMVFCANQSLPFIQPGDGKKGVVLSRMYAPQRAPEVQYYSSFFDQLGYEIYSLPDSVSDFEGMGDALWHPGRFLLWGGYGFRSSVSAYTALEGMLGVSVVALKLSDPDFYHLDTCLSVLNENTALVYPGAFDRDGLDLIHMHFDRVLYAPENEARSLLAVNAHSVDGNNVIIQAGCTKTVSILRTEGFNPIEVRTDEFLKAGGSVFCMKQMFW